MACSRWGWQQHTGQALPAPSTAAVTHNCPPLSPAASLPVYRRTFRRVLRQNEKFYQRFPTDVEAAQVRLIVVWSPPKHVWSM